jgi:hypothetical protein
VQDSAISVRVMRDIFLSSSHKVSYKSPTITYGYS